MKRLYILLTLLLAAATNLAAQTDGYKPFVEEGKRWEWQIQDWYPEVFGGGQVLLTPYNYLISGDTIINDLAYKKVWFNNGENYVGAVREKGKVVYFVDPGRQSKEIKLYDFNTPQATDFTSEFVFEPIIRQGRNGFVTNAGLGEAYYIEGIGFDHNCAGDTFEPFPVYGTGYKNNSLNFVSDASGKVIYRGLGYQNPYPFVEQGKRWFCHHSKGAWEGEERIDEDYQYVIRGEEMIDGKTYARVLKINDGEKESQAKVYCYVREEGQRVYVKNPNFHYDYLITADDDEVVLYDFDDPGSQFRYDYGDEIEPIGQIQGRNAFTTGFELIVEGIGIDGGLWGQGDPFMFIIPLSTCGPCNDIYGLRYVEDAEGNKIYIGQLGYSSVHQVDAKTGQISFDGRSLRVTGQGVVDVINTSGAVVGHHSVSSATATISTADLPSGIYLVQLSTATGRQTKKIVIP